MHLFFPLAYLNLDDHSQSVIQRGQDIPAVSTWGADSETSLKKALFELREALARANCQVECVLAALHTYPVGRPVCNPSIDLFFHWTDVYPVPPSGLGWIQWARQDLDPGLLALDEKDKQVPKQGCEIFWDLQRHLGRFNISNCVHYYALGT